MKLSSDCKNALTIAKVSLNYAEMTSSLLAKMICINEPDRRGPWQCYMPLSSVIK